MTNEEFHRQMKKLTDGEDLEFCAGKLRVSVTTLQRWVNGESLPFPTGRQPAVAALEKLKVDKHQL